MVSASLTSEILEVSHEMKEQQINGERLLRQIPDSHGTILSRGAWHSLPE